MFGGMSIAGGPANPSRAMVIARCLATPFNSLPIRMPDKYADISTAVAGPWTRYNIVFGAGNTEYTWFQFRDLSRCIVQKKYVNTACVYSMTARNPTATGIEIKADGGVVPIFRGAFFKTSGSSDYPSTVFGGTPDGTSEGPYRFFWFDVGDEVDITYTWAVGTGLGFTLSFDKWTNDGGVEIGAASAPEVAFGAASGTTNTSYIFSAAGYYTARITFYTVLAASTEIPDTFSFSFDFLTCTTTTAVRYIHFHAPDLTLQIGSINGHRLIAGASMYTNTSAPNYRSGSIVSASLGPTLDWYDFVTYSAINAVQGAVMREAKNGVYGHLKPAGPEDFNLKTTFSVSNGTVADSWYSLRPTSNFLAHSVAISETLGQNGVFTYGVMYEYPTENRNLDTRLPSDSSATMEMALNAFKSIDQFSENPTHYLQALMSAKAGVGHLLRGVERYGPRIITGARRVRRWIGE
jgi:hypothetical protein